jgi:hypothetical protein
MGVERELTITGDFPISMLLLLKLLVSKLMLTSAVDAVTLRGEEGEVATTLRLRHGSSLDLPIIPTASAIFMLPTDDPAALLSSDAKILLLPRRLCSRLLMMIKSNRTTYLLLLLESTHPSAAMLAALVLLKGMKERASYNREIKRRFD